MNEPKWNSNYSNRCLYRSRRGWFLGVCQGLADYSGIGVGWIRLAVFLVVLATWFLPVFLVYVVVGICLKPEPVIRPSSVGEWEFYNGYVAQRQVSLAHLKQKFDDLDRRARRVEDVVTARGFSWEQRLQKDTIRE
jgi:phage shock protein C